MNELAAPAAAPTEGSAPTGDAPTENVVPHETFQATLGEEFSANESFADFKDVNGLAKAYLDTKTMVGNSMRVPSNEASQEDWDKFYSRLNEQTGNRLMPRPNGEDKEAMSNLYTAMGRPSEATKYEFDTEGIDEARTDLIKQAAFDVGISNAQLSGVMETLAADTKVQQDAQMTQHETSMKELRQEWGLAYDDKLRAASLVKDTFFKDVPYTVDQMGVSTIKSFALIGEKFGGEGSGLTDMQGTEARGMTPDEAKLQIAEIYANDKGEHKHAYWDRTSAGHDAAKQLMRKLQIAADPGSENQQITFGT